MRPSVQDPSHVRWMPDTEVSCDLPCPSCWPLPQKRESLCSENSLYSAEMTMTTGKVAKVAAFGHFTVDLTP